MKISLKDRLIRYLKGQKDFMTKIEEKLKEVRERVFAITEAADEGNSKLYGHLGAQLINFIETDLIESQREEIEKLVTLAGNEPITNEMLEGEKDKIYQRGYMNAKDDILAALKKS